MPLARLDVKDDLGTITIDNAPANLYTWDLMVELRAALDAAIERPVRALLVRAEGPNFSGGANVAMFQNVSAAEARSRFMAGLPMVHTLEDAPFPVVAEVQGLCLAAGLEVALACDLIYAGRSAKFSQVEAMIGAATFLGGVERLAERAGAARAKEIVFSADLYDAETFERWNIVNRVVDDDELETEAREAAERLASGPTRAHNVTKRLVRGYLDNGVRAADSLIFDVATALFETDDMQSNVATLLEHGAREQRERARFAGR
jgi:enoyl-CoA hydratase/carnithine racemase